MSTCTTAYIQHFAPSESHCLFLMRMPVIIFTKISHRPAGSINVSIVSLNDFQDRRTLFPFFKIVVNLMPEGILFIRQHTFTCSTSGRCLLSFWPSFVP